MAQKSSKETCLTWSQMHEKLRWLNFKIAQNLDHVSFYWDGSLFWGLDKIKSGSKNISAPVWIWSKSYCIQIECFSSGSKENFEPKAAEADGPKGTTRTPGQASAGRRRPRRPEFLRSLFPQPRRPWTETRITATTLGTGTRASKNRTDHMG